MYVCMYVCMYVLVGVWFRKICFLAPTDYFGDCCEAIRLALGWDIVPVLGHLIPEQVEGLEP